MVDHLNPRYALVTGGGSGLGRAFCLRLARVGWHVAVTDIDLAAAEQTCKEVQAAGGSAVAMQFDVADVTAWQGIGAWLRGAWPRLDLLVNNAGVCAAGDVGKLGLDDFQLVLDVNFVGVLNGCHTLVPWLKQTTPCGHIVNIASIFGLISPPSMAAYNTSKAAVVALSETLYGELAPLGIGVTVVAPGFFSSQLVERGKFATDQQRTIAKQYEQSAQLTADQVVEQTLTAVERKQLYVVPGRKARWLWRLKRWLPARFAKLLVWRYQRKLQQLDVAD